MGRYKVINYFIKKYGYKTYLEIGVAMPELNYDKVECESKEGCDPYTQKVFDFNYNGLTEYYASLVTYRMTSDEMFEKMPDDKKYDIIFIDGYHTEEQSKRDICNSLRHLNHNGMLMVHDCLPLREEYARDERECEEWYGAVYKSILDLEKIGFKYACADEFGLIPYQEMTPETEAEYMKPSLYEYKDYEENDRARMHIITKEKYGAKIAIYHNSKYLVEHPVYDTSGNLAFGATEYWVHGIAEELGKRCFDVTLFSDVLPLSEHKFFKYEKRDSERLKDTFDFGFFTTDIERSRELPNIGKVFVFPSCEYFNTNFEGFVGISRAGMLSDWQKGLFKQAYSMPEKIFFRHFLPCKYEQYDNYKDYNKENAMVWSSAPIRGLRFFIERVMPKIRDVFPDFKLYICGYTKDHYEDEWPVYVNGVQKMINADRDELAELQKKSKIWVYPNIGRSETGGYFYETYCVTAVENALAGNAIVCFGGKDGISDTLKGYEGFLDSKDYNEHSDNFMLHYEYMARLLADRAIEILSDEKLRERLAEQARNLCIGYTWDKEGKIISDEICRL